MEDRAVCGVDHDDAGRGNGTQGGGENLIEIVPVGPVSDDKKIPVEKMDVEALRASRDAVSNWDSCQLAAGPNHIGWINDPATVYLKKRRKIGRQGSNSVTINANPNLTEDQLPRGLNEGVNIGCDAEPNRRVIKRSATALWPGLGVPANAFWSMRLLKYTVASSSR